jgi:hypothetical protein
MRLNWKDMSKKHVFPKIRKLQSEIVNRVAALSVDVAVDQVSLQAYVVQEWNNLGRFLIMAYNNGLKHYPVVGSHYGYPASWLQSIGFRKSLLPYLVQPDYQSDLGNVEQVDGTLLSNMPPSGSPASLMGVLLVGVMIGAMAVVVLAWLSGVKVGATKGCTDYRQLASS